MTGRHWANSGSSRRCRRPMTPTHWRPPCGSTGKHTSAAWTLLTKPEHAVMLAGPALLLLLWQCGLWWLRRHWGLDHACTGLRQMLQADLRLARYRLLYHALGLPLGALM